MPLKSICQIKKGKNDSKSYLDITVDCKKLFDDWSSKLQPYAKMYGKSVKAKSKANPKKGADGKKAERRRREQFEEENGGEEGNGVRIRRTQ